MPVMPAAGGEDLRSSFLDLIKQGTKLKPVDEKETSEAPSPVQEESGEPSHLDELKKRLASMRRVMVQAEVSDDSSDSDLDLPEDPGPRTAPAPTESQMARDSLKHAPAPAKPTHVQSNSMVDKIAAMAQMRSGGDSDSDDWSEDGF
ncbi:WH2 domain [Carpediemonas membranifera]|uniref:WH2 domain n=1 Tax=Carpediemonas membranifera TaxID=201153 RepID=A0A8J6E5G7_9EUKA|nr:WH2 domain [Carpediemonas membranifera]|eukprot:KAG9395737.1 WH2 domain [Carpediemonas membranifera]